MKRGGSFQDWTDRETLHKAWDFWVKLKHKPLTFGEYYCFMYRKQESPCPDILLDADQSGVGAYYRILRHYEMLEWYMKNYGD